MHTAKKTLLSFSGTILLVSLAAIALAIAAFHGVSAQETGGVGGSPAFPRDDNPRTQSIFIHDMEPGETVEDGIEVSNNSSSTQEIGLFAVDGRVASGGSFACAQNTEESKDAGAWISLSQDTVTLAAGERQVVPFTISAPADASPGEHNGCIAIQSLDQEPEVTEGGVTLRTRSAVRVAMTIEGEIEKQLEFTDLAYLLRDSEEARLSASLRNSGNVSIDTEISITLRNLFWTVRDEVGGTFPVLAGSTADYNFGAERPFWGGVYILSADATFDPDPTHGIGQTGESETISESRVVFVRPDNTALGIVSIVSLLVLTLAYSLLKRKRLRKTWRAANNTYTVKQGEHLHDIAEKHDTHWRKLALANNMKPPYHLKSGQKLIVPPSKKE